MQNSSRCTPASSPGVPPGRRALMGDCDSAPGVRAADSEQAQSRAAWARAEPRDRCDLDHPVVTWRGRRAAGSRENGRHARAPVVFLPDNAEATSSALWMPREPGRRRLWAACGFLGDSATPRMRPSMQSRFRSQQGCLRPPDRSYRPGGPVPAPCGHANRRWGLDAACATRARLRGLPDVETTASGPTAYDHLV